MLIEEEEEGEKREREKNHTTRNEMQECSKEQAFYSIKLSSR
jgi:hypothetical protein